LCIGTHGSLGSVLVDAELEGTAVVTTRHEPPLPAQQVVRGLLLPISGVYSSTF
jgi:hypothetical protein